MRPFDYLIVAWLGAVSGALFMVAWDVVSIVAHHPELLQSP